MEPLLSRDLESDSSEDSFHREPNSESRWYYLNHWLRWDRPIRLRSSFSSEKFIARSPTSPRRLSRWTLPLGPRKIVLLPLLAAAILGIACVTSLSFAVLSWIRDEQHLNPYGVPVGHDGFSKSHAIEALKHVKPMPCHSHNDYWRRTPLYEAISHGCTGVEADIWHFEDDDTLYVGHDTAHLSSTHTFEDLYVKPILNLLRRRNLVSPRPTKGRRNGIFDQDPFQSLILLVDFKTSGPELLSRVEAQLEPLRANDFLTYYDGSTLVHRPVTIVGTGNAPFNLLTNSSYRDIFFDAPLADLYLPPDTSEPGSSAPQFSSQSQHHSGQGRIGTANVKPSDYDGSNSFYASVSFTASIGYPWFGKLTDYQIELIRGQIRGAHKQGLQARYWSTPSWPRTWRDHVWSVLIQEGADMLNADDLEDAVMRLSSDS